MSATLRVFAQALLYVPLMVLLGTFSTYPPFTAVPPNHAVLRLSLTHAGNRLADCRERSPEELAKLPANMRAQLDCSRERVPVRVEITLAGKPLFEATAAPSGLRKDGASTLYRRLVIPAGRHKIHARLADGRDGAFTYSQEAEIDVQPGGSLIIDFSAAKGGFLFRS